MTKKRAIALLIVVATLPAGGALADRGYPRARGYGAYPDVEREAWAYEYFLRCDYLDALAKYGDDIDARRACHGMLFN